MPAWYGICHAWAAASIMEPEPRCPVTKNGVTFYPYDIKGLLTQYYEGGDLPTVYSGTRFDGPNTPVKTDEYYRYADPTRRDIGPGFFHIALTNVIGRFQRGVLIDVDNTYAVWNQPIPSYEVQKLEFVDPNKLAGNQWFVSTYPFNSRTKYLVQTRLKVDWIEEAYVDGELVGTGRVDEFIRTKIYKYVLELNSTYEIIGGEWINDSIQDHPDQLWIPVRTPRSNEVSKTGFVYAEIQQLLQESISCAPPTPTPELTTPAPTTGEPQPTSAPETPSGKPTPAPEPTTPLPTPVVTTPVPTKPVPTTPPPTTPEPTKPVPTTSAPVSGRPCGNEKDGVLPCPSGEYCQPWNPYYYQCRSIDTSTCGQPEVGIDFNGDDIATVEVRLPELCCDKCHETKGCKAYTFVNYNTDGKARCYLKSGTGKKQKLAGAVSAVLSAPACSVPSGGQCGNDQSGAVTAVLRLRAARHTHL